MYGLPAGFIPDEDLLPGQRFVHLPDEDETAVPVVLPAQLLGFISNMNSPEMLDRFAEVVYAEIKKAMDRSERVKRNVSKSMARFGVSVITDEVIKKVIRSLLSQFLSNINEENLPRNFTLRLFPGLDTETMAVPIQIVGYSRKMPGTGIAVPLPYLERWNRMFHEETAGILTKMFAGDPEITYSELHVQTGGFEETVALASVLREMGFTVESATEEAERLEAELKSLSAEADRLKREARRMRDLSQALSRGTLDLLDPAVPAGRNGHRQRPLAERPGAAAAHRHPARGWGAPGGHPDHLPVRGCADRRPRLRPGPGAGARRAVDVRIPGSRPVWRRATRRPPTCSACRSRWTRRSSRWVSSSASSPVSSRR